MFYIVGLGPGSKDYMLKSAIDILNKCDYVLGFKRALDSLDFICAEKIYMKKLSDADKFISEDTKYKDKNIALTASGDPLFYGITNYIKSKSVVEFEVIPGISSFQYLLSKVKIPWNNAYLGSLHGREEDFIEQVRNNNLSVWLTDNVNTPQKLSNMLYENNINCTVIIGENLSYDDECISVGKPQQFSKKHFNSLNVFVVRCN